MDFKTELTLSIKTGNFSIAFDPSYIQKSCKKIPGLGWYWSVSANQSKSELEIVGLAVLDNDNQTAFHLEAVQTFLDKRIKTLIDWYIDVISKRIIHLQKLSHYIVADAYFSKKKFVDGLNELKMYIISRLRDDADLLYRSYADSTRKKERPKMYAGKIDFKNINLEYFEFVDKQNGVKIYTAICNNKSLKKNIRIVLTIDKEKKANKNHKIYFSIDVYQMATSILNFYKNRFQIEFLYRDAKQHTGLEHSQARNENKLHFHFNVALISINVAKITHYLNIPKELRNSFSMCDIKTYNHNKLLLNQFFDMFVINPNLALNNKRFEQLLYYGTIAA